MRYKVSFAKKGGMGRMCTNKTFRKKSKAQEYADSLNKYGMGHRKARVVKYKKR